MWWVVFKVWWVGFGTSGPTRFLLSFIILPLSLFLFRFSSLSTTPSSPPLLLRFPLLLLYLLMHPARVSPHSRYSSEFFVRCLYLSSSHLPVRLSRLSSPLPLLFSAFAGVVPRLTLKDSRTTTAICCSRRGLSKAKNKKRFVG